MTVPNESLWEEVRCERRSLLGPKQNLQIGTWNVRTMCDCSKSNQILREMQVYKLDILCLSECRLKDSGKMLLEDGTTLIFSGNADQCIRGVGIAIRKQFSKCLLEWKPINDRLIKARFNSKYAKTTIIQCYAPTNQATDDDKDNFYEILQREIDLVPSHDVLIVLGDMNAKVGSNNSGREQVMGKHGLGVINDNGERFCELCTNNNLVIGGTIFPHKRIHKETWTSPDGITKNQIDHFTINKKWRNSLQDVRVYRGADVHSDHNLLVGTLKLKLRKSENPANPTRRKYDTSKLKNNDIKQQFKLELRNRFQILENEQEFQTEEVNSVEGKWNNFKLAFQKTSENVLGFKKNKSKPWISNETWSKIDERKKIKAKMLGTNSPETKEELKAEYSEQDRKVKRSARKDKRDYIEDLAGKAETAAIHGDSRELYRITKLLAGKKPASSNTLKNKQGQILTTEREKADRWVEHFKEVLNRPEPLIIADPESAEADLDINIDAPTDAEVRRAIESLKSNKSPGIDLIQAEILKADLDTSTKYLSDLFRAIWMEETVPEDWCKGVITKLPKKGDLSNCDNWRGITLLSIASKVFCKILLFRIEDEIDLLLREEQAGFRKSRGCIDQIFALRDIIEQASEWQKPLFINFVDFKKAFDSICRVAIWRILRNYGIPAKIVNLIKLFYNKFECCVDLNTQLSDWFEVQTGVRQGCIISPILFLIVIDWVMRQTNQGSNGLGWHAANVDDLDFADDLAILADCITDLQNKTNRLSNFAEQTGLIINADKTKAMYIPNDNAVAPIIVDNNTIEVVEEFTYLGSIINPKEGAAADIKSRINKASATFAILKPVWKSNKYSERTKIRIYNSNVKSILMYGSECWRENVQNFKKLDAFHNTCLRRICRIYWPERISNKNLHKRTNSEAMSLQIKKKRLSWLGHVLRMNNRRLTKQTFKWIPEGQRKRGKPKGTWRRTIEADLQKANLTLDEVETEAQNRNGWRALVAALCSQVE